MMPWSTSVAGSLLGSWLRDYERVQRAAVVFLYLQIGCALVGSLGALYNGLLLIHLILALFALIAIESNNQKLGRTYAVLLACGILLDILWFIFFSHEIRKMSSETYGHLFVFSLRLTLWMQIIGFLLRSLSSLLWIQMYRLGLSSMENTAYVEADGDAGNFLDPPTNDIARQNSSIFISSGSIYNPVHYSPLFEDAQEKGYLNEVGHPAVSNNSGILSQKFYLHISVNTEGCVFCMEFIVFLRYLGSSVELKLFSRMEDLLPSPLRDLRRLISHNSVSASAAEPPELKS